VVHSVMRTDNFHERPLRGTANWIDLEGGREAGDGDAPAGAAAGATATTTESVLFEWCESSANPQFKLISQMVRQQPPA
ncbi:MAG: hypothetical protein ACK53V_10750, partial [Planctomycetota bacterium]